MSQLPERYRVAIAPLIDKAREFLEKGEELAAMAFVGNFTTGAVVPTPLFGRGPADKDVAARSVKMLAEQLDADFVFVLMEAYSLRADKVARYEEILDKYGSLADCPASWRIDVVSLSLETRHGVWSPRCRSGRRASVRRSARLRCRSSGITPKCRGGSRICCR